MREYSVSLTRRTSISDLIRVASERRPPNFEPRMRRSPAFVLIWDRLDWSLVNSWMAIACQLCSLQKDKTSSRISDLSPHAL